MSGEVRTSHRNRRELAGARSGNDLKDIAKDEATFSIDSIHTVNQQTIVKSVQTVLLQWINETSATPYTLLTSQINTTRSAFLKTVFMDEQRYKNAQLCRKQ